MSVKPSIGDEPAFPGVNPIMIGNDVTDTHTGMTYRQWAIMTLGAGMMGIQMKALEDPVAIIIRVTDAIIARLDVEREGKL